MTWRKVMCIVVSLLPMRLIAAEVNYSAGMSMLHSTNINHLHIPTDNELSETLRGSLSVTENTADLVADMRASLEASHYTNNLIADQTSGQLYGSSLLNIHPGMLEWFVSDIFTQIAIDTLSSDAPGNRQNVNAFSTGPNYFIHLDRRSNIELEGRVEDYSYENVNTDNNRVSLTSRLLYDLNSSMSTSVNYEFERVEYDDNSLNNSYDRNDVYLGFVYHRNTNSMELNAGYSKILNDLTVDRNISRYFVALQNQRNRTTVIRAEYISELSDSSNDIQGVINANNGGGSIISASADLYIRTTARINYRKTLSNGSLAIILHNTNSDYLNTSDQDEIEKGIYISSIMSIHGRSHLAFDGNYMQTSYENIAPIRIDDDSAYGLTYSYYLGRNLNADLRAEYFERESTDFQENYDDTRIILTLEFATR